MHVWYIMYTVSYVFSYVAMLSIESHWVMLTSVLYVTMCDIYIVTPDNHYYPNTACHHCHNLQHYLLNGTNYFTSNTQLLFLPGIHYLNSNLIIYNISLIGNTMQLKLPYQSIVSTVIHWIIVRIAMANSSLITMKIFWSQNVSFACKKAKWCL